MLQDSISTAHVALTAGALLAAYTFASLVVLPLLSSQTKFLNSQSWVGLRKQVFSHVRGGFDAIRRTRELVAEGHQKVRINHAVE